MTGGEKRGTAMRKQKVSRSPHGYTSHSVRVKKTVRDDRKKKVLRQKRSYECVQSSHKTAMKGANKKHSA